MLDAVSKAGVFHKSVNMIQTFHLLSDVASLHHRQGFLRLSQCYPRVALKHTSAQVNLPRQPVPALNDTLRKFVRSAKPFVTPAELTVTESHIASFECKDGPTLQKLLEERAKKMDNWLADWWLVAAYLGYRLPVVIHSSPGLIFPHQQFHTQDDFLKYAAHLTVAALHGKELIHSNKYPVDMAGKEPLDMTQYTKVFGTCRIPAPEVDKMWFMDQENPSRYIVVARNNHFFKVDVYDKQCQLLDGNTILTQLKSILCEATEPAEPVGILTSEHRDTWAKIYPDLMNDPQNKASVETIQKALFLVCLDEPSCHLTAPTFATEAALRIVHGGGSKASSGNRWFDKTIQVVVSSDGANGITCEHSPAEAVPMASLMDFCLNFMKNNKLDTCAAPPDVPKPEKLNFTLSPAIKCAIQEAQTNLDKLVNDTEFISCTFPCYGKNFAKSQRVSPDSYIQMAIQLAFYRLHNKPGAHYESAATRKYYLGRTETIRSCSLESVKFAQTMLDCNCSAAEKKQALLNAINYHKEYAVMAANGHGVDRHLLGLKLIAAENCMNIHPLYQDPAYTRSNHFRVTTSQVAGRCDAVMCYGPVVPDGYACCYNPLPDSINFGLAAFKSCSETSVKSFHDALMTSLEEMKEVMETGGVWRNEIVLQEKKTRLHKQDILQK